MILIFLNRINEINDNTFNIKTIIYSIQMYSYVWFAKAEASRVRWGRWREGW